MSGASFFTSVMLAFLLFFTIALHDKPTLPKQKSGDHASALTVALVGIDRLWLLALVSALDRAQVRAFVARVLRIAWNIGRALIAFARSVSLVRTIAFSVIS